MVSTHFLRFDKPVQLAAKQQLEEQMRMHVFMGNAE